MKILLVLPKFPSWGPKFFNLGSPLALLSLKSVTPKNHHIQIINEGYESIDFEDDYDLIGITSCTNNVTRAYKIADKFRKRGKTVVLGGIHVSSLPEEAKQHADSVVVGEGEDIWPLLLDDFENKKLKPFYIQKSPVDLNKIPPIFEEDSERDPVIQISRGCPVGCEFCTITNQKFGKVFRAKPVDLVLKEIEHMNSSFFVFVDASLTIKPDFTKEIFKGMKDLNKKFTCSANLNVLANDDEFLKLAHEAGCVDFFTGFESISQDTIDSVGKGTNRIEEYKKAVDKIHDNGIAVTGCFLFGLDSDTPDIFDKTFIAIKNLDIDTPLFNTLTPYPGTPVFNRLEREDRILTKDWAKYTGEDIVFQPKKLTINELYTGPKKLIKKFYSIHRSSVRMVKSIKLGFHPWLQVGMRNLENIRSSHNIKLK